MSATHATLVAKDQVRSREFDLRMAAFQKRADYTNPGQPRWLTVGPRA